MKKILITIISVIILGVIILITKGGMAPVKQEVFNNNETETKKEQSILTMLAENADTQSAELKAVDGSNSSGIAHRLIENGLLYHAVVAFMPDPKEGIQYEGWLVQPSPLKFFSTGVMKKNQEGAWVLEYTAEGDFTEYYRVVITKENIIDAIPEAHIIEGDFSKTVYNQERTAVIKDFKFSPAALFELFTKYNI